MNTLTNKNSFSKSFSNKTVLLIGPLVALAHKILLSNRHSLLLLTVLFSSSVLAQNVYVSPNGSDTTGAGTVLQPWATISFALGQVADGAVIEVAPGEYQGRVRLNRKFATGITIRSTVPYRARLRYNQGAVVICFTCGGITIEGFDIAHASGNTIGLVVQIQNSEVSNVTLRNNIIHDSTNNDLLKINNGARNIVVEGNMFYNQQGSDEHIDINSVQNVTVRDNVFFNTTAQSVTSSFVLIKDSNGSSDGVLGSKNITVKRNVFLNWQGNTGQSFVRIGEDGTPNFEADGVLVENNLMLGNSTRMMRSAFTVQGSRNVTFRFNTVVGDLPSRSFAARLLAIGSNQANQNIEFSNNIWSDPSGTMGQEGFVGADVFDAPSGDNASVTVFNNLYFNGVNPIPTDTSQEVNVGDDTAAVFGDPRLPGQSGLVLPDWNGNQFGGGLPTIRAVFERMVSRYGSLGVGSAALNRASSVDIPADDILGAKRGSNPDIGAFERGAIPSGPPSTLRNAMLSWLILLIE